MRCVTVGLIAVLLAGCTASWRAPVETRSKRPPSTGTARPLVAASEYRVQRGDTLYGIAWQKGIDYRLVAAWNGIRPPYRIYAGQTLRLAPPATRRTPPPAAPRVARSEPNPTPTRPRAAPPQPPPTTAPTQRTYKPVPPAPVAATAQQLAWRWPAQGQIVSTFKSGDTLRQGIKIAGRNGDPIHASEGGKVVYSGSGLIGYGQLIIVKHNDNYLSAYGHNRTMLVREGDQVTKGQKIAEMGAANNGKPVLHFEIRRDGKPVDPQRLLPRR